MLRTAFMSHAHADNAICKRYADALKARGIDVWIDLVDAQKGHTLSTNITDELERRSVFILMVTANSNASHWVDDELSIYISLRNDQATHVVQGQPRLILPVILESVSAPIKVRSANAITAVGRAFDEVVQDIAHALGASGSISPPQPPPSSNDWDPIPTLARLARLGFQGWRVRKTGVEFLLPPTCPVPAGTFTMGSDKAHDFQADDEMPQYAIPVGSFIIGTYPVTVAEYACFVKATNRTVPRDFGEVTWQKQQAERQDHPVVCITWHDALAYAQWLAQVTDEPYRLPTEAEWEHAARGTDGRIYPWGNQWDKTRANTSDGGPGMTTPIGSYSQGASPVGAFDMSGNVWEWTSTIFQPYPYNAIDGREDPKASGVRVLRGGSWNHYPRYARAAYRIDLDPASTVSSIGARVVRSGAG